jgi:phycocyanin alpha chain
LTSATTVTDSQSSFSSPPTLADLHREIRGRKSRLEAAERLSDNAEILVKLTATAICQKFPQYFDNSQIQAKCAYDIEIFVRGIAYSLIVGNTDFIDDMLLPGLEEVYRCFALSPRCAIDALSFLKANHHLSGDAAIEANVYIDHIIHAISQFSESSPSILNSEDSENPESMRGVVVISHPSQRFFTRQVDFQSAASSQWKPHIIISRRILEDNDE